MSAPGLWGTVTYGDGARVPLRRERCRTKPNNTAGTHACRQHETHEGMHRCICGLRWNEHGQVQK